jgi:adenosylcobinamide-GDP ribazoletransferase
MSDVLRLAVGTLTRVPIAAPRRIVRSTAAGAMLLAPLVGALLALLVGLAAQGLATWSGPSLTPTLVAALAVAALAYLTRGLHLDGLADSADALGSGRPAEQALQIARRSDIGPFGVVTLVLVILIQVLAFGGVVGAGHAAIGLVIAVGSSRLTLVLCCMRGVPAARPDGLGATVAGTVPVPATIAAILGWTALCAVVCTWLAPDLLLSALTAVVGCVAAGGLMLVICIRRLGGITGDVLGAAIEISMAASLVILVAY